MGVRVGLQVCGQGSGMWAGLRYVGGAKAIRWTAATALSLSAAPGWLCAPHACLTPRSEGPDKEVGRIRRNVALAPYPSVLRRGGPRCEVRGEAMALLHRPSRWQPREGQGQPSSCSAAERSPLLLQSQPVAAHDRVCLQGLP